jgi:hypothetical protein
MPYEIVAYDDVEGDDVGWDDEVGARGNKRRLARRSERREGRGRGRNRGAPQTEGMNLVASSQRIQPFGLGINAAVAAGASVQFIQTAQKAMQPMSLIVGSGLLDTVTVTQFAIGGTNCLGGLAAVPASMFSSLGTQNTFMFPPMTPGIQANIILNNGGAAATVISAALRVVVGHDD